MMDKTTNPFWYKCQICTLPAANPYVDEYREDVICSQCQINPATSFAHRIQSFHHLGGIETIPKKYQKETVRLLIKSYEDEIKRLEGYL